MSIEKSVIVIFLIDPSQKAIVSNPFRFVQTQMKSSIIPYFSYVTYKHPPFFMSHDSYYWPDSQLSIIKRKADSAYRSYGQILVPQCTINPFPK